MSALNLCAGYQQPHRKVDSLEHLGDVLNQDRLFWGSVHCLYLCCRGENAPPCWVRHVLLLSSEVALVDRDEERHALPMKLQKGAAPCQSFLRVSLAVWHAWSYFLHALENA